MTEHEHESPESILPGTPRVRALDALLREVDGLRLTLETDLSLAASAVEAGRPGLAADILDGDRASVAGFEARALGHLQDLADDADDAERPVVPLRRRRVAVASLSPFVAAAAVVALVLTLAPQAGTRTDPSTPVAAVAAIDRIQEAAAVGDTNTVRAASLQLHEQLLAVAAVAAQNPEMAQQALILLSAEREAIVASGDMAALQDVLRKSTALANKIRNAMPHSVRATVPVPPAIVEPSQAPSPAPAPSSSPAAKPKPATSPSAAPKPKPTQSPAASPSPSASPEGVGPLGNPMAGDGKS